MNNHIVYAGFDGEICVYVGEGQKDRCLHLNSGASHVYEANFHHFSGRTLDVRILETGLTKEQSLKLEQEYITKLDPCWNRRSFKLHNSDTVRLYVKGRIREVFKRDLRAKPESIKAKQIETCKYLAGLLNDSGTVLVYKGQVEKSCNLPTGFMSKCLDIDIKYYPLFREIFLVEKHSVSYYKVSLRGWEDC